MEGSLDGPAPKAESARFTSVDARKATIPYAGLLRRKCRQHFARLIPETRDMHLTETGAKPTIPYEP